jgi:hypothetical protein
MYLDQIRGTSKTIFHETSIARIQSCRVRDTKVQEREEYDQAAYSAKADKGDPWPAEQTAEDLN